MYKWKRWKGLNTDKYNRRMRDIEMDIRRLIRKVTKGRGDKEWRVQKAKKIVRITEDGIDQGTVLGLTRTIC